MFIPPAMLYAVEKLGVMPRNFYLKTLLEVTFITGELYIAAPLAIAIYPQQGTIKANELEPEFRNIRNEHGDVIREFRFNKGL